MPSNIILVLDRGYGDYGPEESAVAGTDFELRIYDGVDLDRTQKLAAVHDAAAVLVRYSVVDDEFLDAARELRAVVRYGVGYDTIDLPACTARGVPAAIVKGYGNHSVSDHALAMLLSCIRALPLGELHFETMHTSPPRRDMKEFHECTLGIIGLGRIGTTLARKAQSIFARIIAYDPNIPGSAFTERGAEQVDFETLLSESDCISVHCDLNPTSHHLLDEAAFARMQRRPVIVNTARGAIIDEAALLDALEAGQVHSAGIDVWSIEPAFPHLDALRLHPRVLPTGHYAYYSETALATLQRRAAENAVALLQGECIEDCLNPEVVAR